ncbi:MAG TPA: substrate-binding domain-containing protein, partial [Chloroflexota bacterium]|nr:substrate-binding domain-containing protein [Chloroflexota bacterium]
LLRPVLTAKDRPTAFVAASDLNAYLIMKECRELGIRIPDDMSLVGYDNDAFSDHTTPPLTTMKVDKDYMGRLAVRRLYDRILESQERVLPKQAIHIHVPSTLVRRDSCAKPSR